MEIPEEFREWIELLPESKALTERNYTFRIAENESEEKRDGYIVFKGNALTETIRIYQAPKGVLVLSERAFHVPAEGKEIAVELKTNLDYEVQILDNASSWITRLETKAVREDRLDFQIAANNKETERTARIAIKDKNSDLSDTVSLTQVPKGTYNGDLVWTAEFDLTEFHDAGHTKVMGNLVIQGDKLKDLKKLENCLTEVYGSITLNCSSLFSLEGLYKLKKITGDLIVQDGVMTNWEGLRGLETIGGDFRLIDSSSLSTLSSFSGLNSLKSIGGDFELRTSSLNDLSSFEGLESLETIGGSFKIMATVLGRESSSLSSLSSFSGLSSLKSIGGDFELNASIFHSSSSIFSKLSSFKGLESLETIGGSFKVITALNYNMSSTSYLSLVSFSGLNSLKSIGGDFEISVDYQPNNLLGSNNFLSNLSSFEGLDNLETIGGDFKVIASSGRQDSHTLTSLSSFRGLNSLKSIGGDFELRASSFWYSSSLTKLSSFEGLESLETVGGSFKVIASSAISLSLSSLTSFGGLSALKDMNKISITGCKKLYDFCDLKNALQDMNGTYTVENNGYNPTKEQILNGECFQTPAE